MNDPFFHAQAATLAARATVKPDAERLGELFRLALQRPPTAKDRDFANGFLVRYTKSLTDTPAADRPQLACAALARVLLASNEFLFAE